MSYGVFENVLQNWPIESFETNSTSSVCGDTRDIFIIQATDDSARQHRKTMHHEEFQENGKKLQILD